MECGLRAPAGCSVGPCGLLCGVWEWGSALGDHNGGARSGAAWMGPSGGVLCVRIPWGLVGICRWGFVVPLLPDCYLVLRNIMSSHWKQTPFF